MEDFNQDTHEDILALSSDLNTLTLISGKDGTSQPVRDAMRNIPSEMQVFSMLPMTKAGLYNGSVLISAWDGEQNSTYVIQLGNKSGQLDQGYLITPDFIKSQLPNLLSNTQDLEPDFPEVFIELPPEEKVPLEPQLEE
ncbi:hypothetical protein N8331_00140, partial [bacterium]|nr:hypothetical protein [bacterium]